MATSSATVPAGLLSTAGDVVPLEGVSVEAKIRDYGATVVLKQRYRNVLDRAIEAVYKLPLAEDAAVCGFEAQVDGRRVSGRVLEREEAFCEYDEAMAAGHGAYLLDEERPDVFTVSVGNVPPGKEVVLQLTTVAELPLEGEDVRFTLPTTISPRYAPEEHRRGVGESEASRLTPPYAAAVPYGLELVVDVEMSVRVAAVESPTHPIAVAVDDRRATVRLATREAAMDRDFVLKVRLAETHAPRALVERGPDGAAYALVSFRPRFEAPQAPSEVVFLVDRSGSMQGTSIAEARNALQLALRSLRPGCHFNVVGFGSRFTPLFATSRAYDDTTLAEAVAHVSRLEADMGGTELLPALAFVLAAPGVPGLPRQVFVLTDGEVTNTDETIALVRRHAARCRVFTFGVGAGASLHLVSGLARAGGGAAELIAPGERIEGKVMRQLARALAPALTGVAVDWPGGRAQAAPHVAPAVFDGGRVLVFGRLESPEAGAAVLRARGPAGEVRFELPIEPASAASGSLVATLWARRAIRDLEEGSSPLHAPRGSRQRRGRDLESRVKDEIVRLSTQYGVLSRHTSWLAVEEREGAEPGEVVLLKVPSAVTRGWHALDEAPAPVFCCQSAIDPDDAGFADYALPSRRYSLASSLSPRESQRPLDRLVALQAADGSWGLDDTLAAIVGLADATLPARVASLLASVPPELRPRVYATALALRWLDENAADARDEWVMLAAKAAEWIERTAGTPALVLLERLGPASRENADLPLT